MSESAQDQGADHGRADLANSRIVTVVIPAQDEASRIGALVEAVRTQDADGFDVQVVVVDDGSRDGTAEAAAAAGAETVGRAARAAGGNPAAARNLGVRIARGDPLIFLDADCLPAPGWLGTLLAVHHRGEVIVGGSLDLPANLPWSARCDYYCGWYHVHSRRPRGYVPNHPPANISVRRDLFLSSRGFEERHPIAFAHEELGWQAELMARGHRIRFEPSAVVYHRNRPGFGNLLRRNYRWGYSAIESKAATGAARMAWLYRYPLLLVALSPALAIAQTGYVVSCWARAGVWEPLLVLPAVLAARLAYAVGMAAGTLRWLGSRGRPVPEVRPRWE